MTKEVYPDGNIRFQLTADDIESAVRHFICACHTEIETGFVINPYQGAETVEVPRDYLAQKSDAAPNAT